MAAYPIVVSIEVVSGVFTAVVFLTICPSLETSEIRSPASVPHQLVAEPTVSSHEDDFVNRASKASTLSLIRISALWKRFDIRPILGPISSAVRRGVPATSPLAREQRIRMYEREGIHHFCPEVWNRKWIAPLGKDCPTTSRVGGCWSYSILEVPSFAELNSLTFVFRSNIEVIVFIYI